MAVSFVNIVFGTPNIVIPQVTTITVIKKNIYEPIEALGNLIAYEHVEITSSVTEKIEKIFFKSGQEVKKGQILVQLNNQFELAELKSAEAELTKAKLAYERAKNLQKNKAVSKATLQERIANFKKAEALLNEIKAKLDELKISAPLNGVLGIKRLSVGALVKPGDVIISLTDIDKIKVAFDVPSVYLSQLRVGEKIFGTVDAYNDMIFEGEIYAIENVVDSITRTIELRALIPNENHLLKPGLLMNVLIKNNQRNVLTIPEESLIKSGKDNYVFLVLNKQKKIYVKLTKISIGQRKQGYVEVTSGLNEGDSIVLHGALKLKDGMEVQVKESKF